MWKLKVSNAMVTRCQTHAYRRPTCKPFYLTDVSNPGLQSKTCHSLSSFIGALESKYLWRKTVAGFTFLDMDFTTLSDRRTFILAVENYLSPKVLILVIVEQSFWENHNVRFHRLSVNKKKKWLNKNLSDFESLWTHRNLVAFYFLFDFEPASNVAFKATQSFA